MATLTSNPKLAAFVLAEASGQRSRKNAVVTQSGAAVKSGTVLAQAGDAGAATFAVDAGKTGNPTAGTITVAPAAIPGKYRVKFNGATTFEVEDPNGFLLGTGSTGVAFSEGGHLTFTLTAGGTAAVDGTTATITVAAGTGKYVPYTANGAAGPAAAILYNHLPAKTGDSKAVVFDCDFEANRFELTGLDAAAEADLAKLDIKVRGVAGLGTISTPAL